MRDKLGRFIKGHSMIKGSEKGWFKEGQKATGNPFPKGNIPWIKGRYHSKETKEKLRELNLGRKYSPEINKKKGRPREKSPSWKGGQYTSKRGYVYILMHEHPNCQKNGYVKRANLVMEKHLGRYLITPEFVHHKKSPDNDKIENLQLCANQSEHRKLYTTR